MGRGPKVLLTTCLLAGLAVLLAWPVPVALSRAAWPSRAPFVALLAWQAVALAGGLSMIGAMLIWGLAPLGDTLLAALRGGIGRVQGGEVTTSLGVMQIFALSAAALLGSHLVLTLIKAAWRTSHQRARHRQVLNLLTKESPANPGTLVLDHETPVAYCLPGFNGSITVLSRGLLQRLNADELRAVLAHEGAHLTQRHDLLVLAFVSWNGALPWLPTSRLSLDAVQELVEMLADDAALQHVTRPVLLRALLTATSGTIAGDSGPREPAASTPVDTGGAPTQELSARRLRRLLAPQPSLPAALQALILCAALLLLAIPTALVIAP